MPLRGIDIDRPAVALAPLLRELAGTRVRRVTTLGSYHVDWVQFAAGRVTPVHNHAGVEHHFVASGSVRARYRDQETSFGSGDYFFWDGREPHTSYAEGDMAASMLMVRAERSGEVPEPYREARSAAEAGSTVIVDDGLQPVKVRAALSHSLSSAAAYFLVLAPDPATIWLNRRALELGRERPVALFRNDRRSTIRLSGEGAFAFLGWDR